jgi:hypothetical protein
LGEADAFPGQGIDAWCANALLAVTTQFGVAEVIADDEKDVRFPGRRRAVRKEAAERRECECGRAG